MRQTSTLHWWFALQSVRSMGTGSEMEADLEMHYNCSEYNRPVGFMGDADGNPGQYRCAHTGRLAEATHWSEICWPAA
jgi:hypothetical protein